MLAPRIVIVKYERPFGRCPTEKQAARLLASVNGRDPISLRDRALLEVAYGSGPRLEEMARLNLASIDLVDGLVRLHGKGDKERLVPLTTPARKSLGAYLKRAREYARNPAQASTLAVQSKNFRD